MKLLYLTWVRSRLDYASVVWSPHTKRNIVKYISTNSAQSYRRLKYWVKICLNITDLLLFTQNKQLGNLSEHAPDKRA